MTALPNFVDHDRPEWHASAACRGHANLFVPEIASRGGKAAQQRVAKAKAICAGCPAIDACREYALAANERHGTWGGLAAHELRELRRAQRPAA